MTTLSDNNDSKNSVRKLRVRIFINKKPLLLSRSNPPRMIRHRARCDFPVPAKASTTCAALVGALIPRNTERCSSSKRCVSAAGIASTAELSWNNPA